MRKTWLLTCPLLIAAAFPARAAVPDPRMLADSTFVQSWKLDNGLRVATRHIPGASGVAVTVAYEVGTDDDAPGREGQAQLLAEIGFTSAAADIPERSREDLASLRPYGWSFLATRRNTMFTEIASLEQFPGVLQQIATRMRGVTVTREGLSAALANVREQMEERVSGPASVSLYHQVREVALGHDDKALLRATPGRELEKLTPAATQELIRQLYVPARAVLSVAGNLDRLDVPALIQNLFGSLPAGKPAGPARRDSLRAGSRQVAVDKASERRGVVGVIAPPLSDPSHPAFYLCSMLISSHVTRLWALAASTLPAGDASGPSFHYALLDEPDLARLFPPGAVTTDDLGTQISSVIQQFYAIVIPQEAFTQTRDGLLWLLGGPMTEEQLERVKRDASAIHSMARSMAGRELFGGEAMWGPYRSRFAALPAGGLQTWMDYYAAPEHQVRLMTVPKR